MSPPAQSGIGIDALSMHREIWDAARNLAYEGYLTALLAPRAARDDLVVLAAFLGEVARIPFLVSEPTLGDIRLQWWRDWLDGLGRHTQPTGNRLADVFGEVITRHDLSKDLIGALLDARADEGYAGYFSDETAYQTHLTATAGAGLALAARIQKIDKTPDFDAVMVDATHAVGTVAVLKRLPQYVARGRWPLPVARDASPSAPRAASDFLYDSEKEREASIVVAIAAARAALRRAKSRSPKISKGGRQVVLELALVEPYLQALDSPDFDPTREFVEISPISRVSRLWLAKWCGLF